MNKKAFYIILLIVLLFPKYYSQSSWEKIKTPTDFNLLKIFYLDSLHCWVAGDSGVIMFSSNQGTDWQVQNSGVANYISDIYFLNKNLGWAVTFELEGFNTRSKILKTTNGGDNWISENYRHLDIILTTIFFNDSLNGWIGGEPFDISYTDDGGSNWNPANVDTGAFSNFPINKLRFSSPQYGFAVGGAVDVAGVVWRTSNSGQLWKAFGIAPDKFDDFLFLDSSSALALSADIERYYPIGELKFNISQSFWDYIDLDKYGRVTSIDQRTPLEIWGTLGCDTSFIVSYDNTNTWDFIPTNDSLCYYGIAFADSLHGIVVAGNGYILKYNPDDPVNVENISIKIPENFILAQNYPNPFNPGTVISYQLPVSSRVILKVYDILGNEITTLVNEEQPPGNYKVEYSIGQSAESVSKPEMASGIYFYQLKTEKFIVTKKMLLLK